eukprot:1183267-Prorocentrum_minimum.AAC.2
MDSAQTRRSQMSYIVRYAKARDRCNYSAKAALSTGAPRTFAEATLQRRPRVKMGSLMTFARAPIGLFPGKSLGVYLSDPGSVGRRRKLNLRTTQTGGADATIRAQ